MWRIDEIKAIIAYWLATIHPYNHCNNVPLCAESLRFHQFLASYSVYEAVKGPDLFLHLNMFAQHCKAGLPLGSENFTSWTSRLYRRKCFQIAKGNIYFLFMGGESDPDHLNPLRATVLELGLQNTGQTFNFCEAFIHCIWLGMSKCHKQIIEIGLRYGIALPRKQLLE